MSVDVFCEIVHSEIKNCRFVYISFMYENGTYNSSV